MLTYYIYAVLFVMAANFAFFFGRAPDFPKDDVVDFPFLALTMFIAILSLVEIRKLKTKADQYDAETRG